MNTTGSLKSLADVTDFLASSLPANIAYYMSIRGSYVFGDKLPREQQTTLQKTPGRPVANEYYILDLFDPRSSAVPGAKPIDPPTIGPLPMHSHVLQLEILGAVYQDSSLRSIVATQCTVIN